jgi:predicted O-methyltransferase YrrM
MKKLFQIISFVQYCFVAKHRKGFGIHSPFVFHLLNRVFFEKEAYYCYKVIESVRQQFLANHQKIYLTDYGTGGKRTKTIAEIAHKTIKSRKYAQLLFRLVNSNHSQQILELGTSLGISTMYLASANLKSNVVTIEGDSALCDLAKKTFYSNNFQNITVIEGNLDFVLEDVVSKMDTLDFVFFDANHTQVATLKYFSICLAKINKNTIFVFDDIHWSADMQRAWHQIAEHPAVRLSIDIFGMGIVWFDTDLMKQQYIVAF